MGASCFAGTIAGSVAQFTHARVGDGGVALFAAGLPVGIMYVLHGDLGRVVQAQGQFITAQFHLNGVAHGGNFPQGDFGAGGKAHVQQVMAQFAAPADGFNQSILPDFQFRQCHILSNLLACRAGRKHYRNTKKV